MQELEYRYLVDVLPVTHSVDAVLCCFHFGSEKLRYKNDKRRWHHGHVCADANKCKLKRRNCAIGGDRPSPWWTCQWWQGRTEPGNHPGCSTAEGRTASWPLPGSEVRGQMEHFKLSQMECPFLTSYFPSLPLTFQYISSSPFLPYVLVLFFTSLLVSLET